MGRQKPVAKDLLANISSSVDAQPAPTQHPKLKQKRIKKAQPKATVTQIDSEDTLLISKLAESEKTTSIPEKRSAETQPSESTRSKRPNHLGHAHSFSLQSFENRKELADKKRVVSSLQKTNKSLQSKMKTLEDQAEAAIKTQNDAEENTESAEAIRKVLEVPKREAKEKMSQAQKELQDALATKEAEVKAADEKGYNEGVADVMADYEKQVKQACNKGFTLGWMTLLKKLEIPDDSSLRNTDVLPLPFPLTPSQSDDDSESEEEVLVRKSKEAAGVKSPIPNEQETSSLIWMDAPKGTWVQLVLEVSFATQEVLGFMATVRR
ncbi:unconventional myosin-XVIIIa-like [Camellia sinensis]|uniref:unconventional myosin-XVIIIa-like n=1 Tax=Camellia sinensis TaxID=4442 RepID=UPI0010359D0A|nr:unconventional myosin-XVIIIa-like [Camellia sinensis]